MQGLSPRSEASVEASEVALGGRGSGPKRRSRWPSGRGWRDLYQKQAWRRISRRQLDAEPCCRLCASHGLVVPASLVDHVVAHRGDPKAFWEVEPGPSSSSLQSLCAQCHSSAKRIGYARAVRRPRDANRWRSPLQPPARYSSGLGRTVGKGAQTT